MPRRSAQERWLLRGVSDDVPSSAQRLPPLEDESQREAEGAELDDGTASLDEGAVSPRS